MEITRLSTKGQIVLPQAIRDSHAWPPGTEFQVEETSDGILLRPTARFPETKIEMVAGFLRPGGKPRTLKEMKAAVDREVMRRHDSGRY